MQSWGLLQHTILYAPNKTHVIDYSDRKSSYPTFIKSFCQLPKYYCINVASVCKCISLMEWKVIIFNWQKSAYYIASQ